MATAKSYKIITLGCKVNQYESAYLNEEFINAGWRHSGKDEKAHVAIINTCIVTQKASRQSRQAIRKAVRENPNGMIAAIGCYPQVFQEELSGIEGVGLIAGNVEKDRIMELVLQAERSGQRTVVLNDFAPGMPFAPLLIKKFPDRTRAYLKIQDGCRAFCSYCIVPFARGPYRSLPPFHLLSMMETLAKGGCREIVLTGIHLGKYGVDLKGGMTLNRLLRAIGREKFPLRVRLSSLEPNEIDQELIEMAGAEKWLCRHFHIPLQSGHDGILKKMKRNYTAYESAKLIKRIHEKIPFAAIGIDLMAGFPGEDDAAHKDTFSLIKDLPVSYLHVFPFSPRPGTAASAFDGQVAPETIKERAEELRILGQGKRTLFYQGCLKKEFPVLAEGWYSEKEKIMKGISDNYLPVLFPSSRDSKNQLVPLWMERLEKNMVLGSKAGV